MIVEEKISRMTMDKNVYIYVYYILLLIIIIVGLLGS